MLRNNSHEPSQEAAGSSVLGALVVPTTIGPSSSEDPGDSTPHPATRAMDVIAASRRRHRFRLNTRTLLDLPYQGSADHTAVPRRGNRVPGRALDQHMCDYVVSVR